MLTFSLVFRHFYVHNLYQAIECDCDNGSHMYNIGTVNKILTWPFGSSEALRHFDNEHVVIQDR
jgi:hypothetical protein